MPVQQTDQRLVLTHPSGSSAEILLYGATVLSWKAGPDPIERVFVSAKAALDGSKPVRGGIPIVFPCFGPPSHPAHVRLGQHGFARSHAWAFDGVVVDDPSSVSVRLTLEPTPSIKAVYDGSFHLAYVVTLGKDTLETELQVSNTGEDTLPFQALFHNYVRAPATDVLVSPLQNKRYYDKTDGGTAKTETRADVDVRAYTDSVYEDGGEAYEVTWADGGLRMKTWGLKDVVVWNPQREAGSKMADMEDGGWEKFVCVEPGHVLGYVEVGAGHVWRGGQVLSVL